MDGHHHCQSDRPCPCPPDPALQELARAALAGNAAAQNELGPSALAAFQIASQPTASITIPGLNDGAVIPPSAFEGATTSNFLRAAALEKAPFSGNVRTIIVLANFADVKMADDRANYFRDLFFSTKKIPSGSVNDYYNEVSRGQVTFSGDVIGPVTLPRTMKEYANGKSGMSGSEPNAQTLARDTINAVVNSQDFGAYDINNDGRVDTFVVVHAGAGAERGGQDLADKIWSLQWNVVNPVKAGSVSIYAFLTIPEDCVLGLACHELGHLVFAWPDLYDGDDKPYDSAGSGRWCLMGAGSWNGFPSGSRPAHPSAWCKVKQGWANVIADDVNGNIQLPDVKTSGDIHRLWKDGDTNSSEYFLLENRQQIMYDTDLPSNGLLIWHIDDNQPNNRDQLHYKVALEQADGLNQLATNHFGQGDAGDPFPGSTHNQTFNDTSNPNSKSYTQQETYVSVTNISNSAATMSMNVTVNPTPNFSPVYHQGDPGNGIGGYDLRSSQDRVFALDYNSSGKQDHLVLYRPGTGTCWILRKAADGSWSPVYAQGDPGSGIGGYDLKSTSDVGFAFDYDGSGKQDHIVWYRPGTGTCWILRKAPDGSWSPVYAQGDPGSGIGGYDLKSGNDRMFAFDYNSSGKLDHLALYRPGTGTFWILQKSATDGSWKAVYAQGDPGQGIGGYDLRSQNDRAFAFDWDSSGKMDHIALYRPGTGTFWVVKNSGGNFSAVMSVGDPGSGIGGYDLASPSDVAFAYDWDHSGKNDHVALYRPGTGTFWVVKRSQSGQWRALYAQGDPGAGVGGYDLKSSQDKMLAFDYDGSGRSDFLVAYRTNASGTIWILKHN